jgi:hypothetical protein
MTGSKELPAPRTINIQEAQKAIQRERESQMTIGDVRKEKDRTIQIIEDKTISIRDELQKLTNTYKISCIGTDTIEAMDIKTATALDTAGLTVDSVINGTDFETTLHMRMDVYLQSYPLRMEEAMMKFTSEYFKDNDTLEHYIREITGSTIEISKYRDQLAQGVHAPSSIQHTCSAIWMEP